MESGKGPSNWITTVIPFNLFDVYLILCWEQRCAIPLPFLLIERENSILAEVRYICHSIERENKLSDKRSIN